MMECDIYKYVFLSVYLPATLFYVAPDNLKDIIITFSSRNVRKISCAFILKVSN